MKTLLLLSFLVSSYSLHAQERIREHEKAKKTFLNWHFFENGRGMSLTPNLSRYMSMLKQSPHNKDAGPITKFIKMRYGFETEGDKLMGVFNVKYKGMDVGVLGCTACHSGRAAGILIPGLGNKTIDPYLIGKDSKWIQRLWGITSRNPDFKYIHEKAMNFSKVISDKNIANLTRGLVSDAIIETFFFKDIGVPYPKDLARAQVKVPHLWGIKEKRPVGIFNDGSLSGETYAWIFGAELFASDSSDHLRAVLPQIKWLTDEVLGKLLPPKYPFEIDRNLIVRGKKLFENNCMKCHGEHELDGEGFPIYTAPKHVRISVVKTDDDKLRAHNQPFIDAVKSGSLGDLLTFNEDILGTGYFAPKLWGIWARFPYLHNGAVPTIRHLLLPPEQRPIVFSMEEAGEAHRFDPKNLGLTIFSSEQLASAMRSAKKGNRNLYYTKRIGHSNQGHYFDSFKKLTEQDRDALIEYLKTL